MVFDTERSNKPADCQSAMVVEAAIEACLDLWSERVTLGRDDKIAGEEAAEVDEFEEYNGVYESGAAHKMRDVCFMMGAVFLAVVFSPLVPLFFLYEAIVERRRAPDYSHMNGHAHH